MMQAAIGDQEDLAARFLAVDHATDIDAGLADDVAAELDRDLGLRKQPGEFGREPGQIGTDDSEVEPRARPGNRECRSRRRC